MGRFKSPGQTQRFLSVHDQTAALFRPKRHRLSARSYRHAQSDAFALWADNTCELTAYTGHERTVTLTQNNLTIPIWSRLAYVPADAPIKSP